MGSLNTHRTEAGGLNKTSGKIFQEGSEFDKQLVFPVIERRLADPGSRSNLALGRALADQAAESAAVGIQFIQMAHELLQQQLVKHDRFHISGRVRGFIADFPALFQGKHAAAALPLAFFTVAVATAAVRLPAAAPAILPFAFRPCGAFIGPVYFLGNGDLLPVQIDETGLGLRGLAVIDIVFHFSSLDFLI